MPLPFPLIRIKDPGYKFTPETTGKTLFGKTKIMDAQAQKWKQHIIDSGMATEKEFEGCTDGEIADIEAQFGLKLPPAYREFLKVMGKNAGEEFLRDATITYPHIVKFRYQADNIAKSAGITIPVTAFVFLIHDYQFLYFDTANGEADPLTYRYLEEDDKPVKLFDSYTDCMASIVQTEVEAWKSLQKS